MGNMIASAAAARLSFVITAEYVTRLPWRS